MIENFQIDVPAYIVGGYVRDMLLDVPSNDVDVVVIGDAIAVAREYAEFVDSEITVHEKFGTATVAGVDFVSARKERYEVNGAMPTVESGTLGDDLRRRDFTVNAMALPLNGGRIVDPFFGQVDLTTGFLTTLHPKSFFDDATRILRGLRYAVRYGFSFSPATEVELKNSLSAGAMDALDGYRIRRELSKIFAESNPADVFQLASEHGVLKAIHPKLAVPEVDNDATEPEFWASMVRSMQSSEVEEVIKRLDPKSAWKKAMRGEICSQ